ncbi:helix-turn-helix domain-containing protein [Pararhizobium haloflavum]|uniref:helix-turn-helix domain-containing protein n=1 Tax=Pararhizobium haloflavum TaxID=2037914 RepID=UPI000C19BAC2|nr:helix-turn-helix domain-containing protein [Pararhizobium haloflavum]
MSKTKFSIIPGWIVTDARLKGRDLQVICLLGRYTNRDGWCFRSQVKMAGQLGCARSTVQLSLDRLVSIGAVERRAGESRDGRDCSYHYRVIYDRDTPAAELATWEGDEAGDEAESVENHSPAGGNAGTPPADISAPPADPGSAPPADPGSAPYKNDPCLTAQAERREREARERAGDAKNGEGENPKAVEREFRRAFPQWPTYVGDSEPAARAAWFALTAGERAEAVARIGDYVNAAKAGGRKAVCSFGVYLGERRWEKLPAREAEAPATHASEAPFGKGWGAMRFAELLREPGPMPAPTRFIQQIIDAGGEQGEREKLAHLARHGWPTVNRMHANAAERRGYSVPVHLLPLGAPFRQVKVGGELWEAWRRAHERRGWPFLPDPGQQEFVWMPEGEDPEAAIKRFMDALGALGGGEAEAAE